MGARTGLPGLPGLLPLDSKSGERDYKDGVKARQADN